MASIPNRTYMEIHGFSLDRYIAHPVEIYEGHTVAPERKGHGIEFNWKALAPQQTKGRFPRLIVF